MTRYDADGRPDSVLHSKANSADHDAILASIKAF